MGVSPSLQNIGDHGLTSSTDCRTQRSVVYAAIHIETDIQKEIYHFSVLTINGDIRTPATKGVKASRDQIADNDVVSPFYR